MPDIPAFKSNHIEAQGYVVESHMQPKLRSNASRNRGFNGIAALQYEHAKLLAPKSSSP